MLGFTLPWLLAHFIGDFLLQTDDMAVYKKRFHKMALVHIFCYSLPFLFTGLSILQIVIILTQHYLQDRYSFISWYCLKMKIFQGELKQDVLPWGHFIVDQIFHILFIWIVLQII